MKRSISQSRLLIFAMIFAIILALGTFIVTVTVPNAVESTEAEAYTTGGTAISTVDGLKSACRANSSGTYYLSSNITWTGAGYNQDYTFSGTLYGNGKTITISTGNTSRTTVGDNKNIGMLFSTLSGTIRDCTIVVNDATYWYEYTGSNTDYTDYAGVICGKLNGGSIINVNISIANGKGLSFYAEDDSSSKSGGYGCIVGAYAGHSGGTSTIKNCTFTLNGGIWGKSEDFNGNGDEGSSTRCHVGGFVGEVDGSTTLNMYNNRFVGSTTGIVGSGLINSNSDHRSGRTGGIVGVVRSSAKLTINALLYEFNGSVHCFRDRDTKCGLLVGYSWGTCTISNIVVPSNITTTRDEGNKGDGGNPATCFSASSITSTAKVTHSGAMGTGAAKAGSGISSITNSITYEVNAYLGSTASSSYGTFKLTPYIDASGSTGGWNATVTPASGYCVSDIKYGSTYDNSYTTKRSDATAFTLWVSSSCTAYAGYVAQQSSTITYTTSGSSGAYDGSGWIVKAQVSIGSSKYDLNCNKTTWYYHSQNASAGDVTSGTYSSEVRTSKNAGTYTMALRTATGANASKLASNTCVYRDSANAPTKLGYYNGQTATCTITKKALSVTKSITGKSYTYNGDRVSANWQNRATIGINGMVSGDTIKFWYTNFSDSNLDNVVYLCKDSDTSKRYAYPMNAGNTTAISGKTCGDFYTLSSTDNLVSFCAKNVGSYSMAILGMTDGNGKASNYTWTSDSDTDAERTVTFTVTQKELTLTSSTNNTSLTYRGTPTASNFSTEYAVCWKVSGMVGSEFLNIRVKYQSGLWIDASNTGTYLNKMTKTDGFNRCNNSIYFTADNAGSYSATIYDFIDDQDTSHDSSKKGYAKNYKWSTSYDTEAERTVAFTIAKKTVSLTWSNTSFTYDKSSHVPTCSAGSLISGDSCSVTVSGAQTNAGSYTATASSLSNANYALPSTKTQSFTINKKTASLTWGTTTFTYNASTQTPSCTAGSLCSGDTCTVTVSGGQTNAGSYTATASSLSNANYALPSTKTTSFTINKKTVSLTWGTTTFTYNASTQTPSCTAGSLCSGDTCTVTVSGGQTNAGSYTATASSLSNANYALPSTKTTSFTINKKTVTLTWTNTSFTYDKTAHKPTCTAGSLCGSDTCTVTVSGEQTNAGSYTATASSLSNANYALPSTQTNSFTINKKTVTLTWGTTSFTYNGNTQTPSCTAGSLVSGDTCTVSVSGGQKNAGSSYTATASSLSNANYALPSAVTTAFSIAQKEVTLTWGTATFIYNKTAQKPTCTAGSLCGSDTCTVTVSGEQTNVGSYTATASSLSNANYKLPSSKTKAFNITQKEISLNWGTTTFTYNAGGQLPTCTAGSLCSGDACTVEVTGEQINAGSYTATASSINNGNYKLPSTVTKEFIINQKEVTLTWGSTTFTYNGNAQKPTCTAGSLCEDDTCTVTVTGAQTNQGTYTATASELSNANYKLPSAVTTSFTINRKSVSGATITLGTALTYNGASQTQTVTKVVIGGLTATFTVSNNTGTNAGDYTLTVTGTGNFTGTQAKAFTIARKSISGATITLGTALTYNGDIQTQTVTKVEIDGLTATFDLSNNMEIDAGTYTLTASGNGNYTGTQTKEFTIARKSISGATVTLGTALTYTGASQTQTVSKVEIAGLNATFSLSDNVKTNAGTYTLTATGTGNFTGTQTKSFTLSPKALTDSSISMASVSAVIYNRNEFKPTPAVTSSSAPNATLVDGTDYTYSYYNNINVGIATVMATGKGNYTGSTSVTFYINEKEVTLVWTNLTFVYDKTAHIPTCTAGSLCDGDTCLVTLSGEKVNVGNYTATAVELSNANYKLPSTVTKAFEITPKTVSLNWTNLAFTYDKTSHLPTCTVESLCNGDTCTASVTGEQVNVGNYIATVTALDNANYQLPSEVTKGFEISPKVATLVWGECAYTYNKTAQKPSCEVGNLCEGDGCTVTVTGEQINQGSYTATASALSNGNYTLPAEVTTPFTIAKKVATLVWGETSFTYDNIAHLPTCTVGNLCEGDDCTVTVTGTETNAGSYTATASELSDDNYALPTLNTKPFVINKANYDMSGVSFTDESFVYDGETHGLTVEGTLPTGLDGIKVTVTYEGNATDVDDGKVTVSAIFATASNNYNVPETKTATVEILAKVIVISWCEDDYIYNGETQVITASYLTVFDEERSLTVATDVEFFHYKAEGYTATVSFATTDHNYILPSTVTKEYHIQRKNIAGAEITLGDKLVYNGTNQTQNVESVTVGSLNVTFDISGNVQKNAGDYTLTVTGNGDFIGSEEKDYTIDKKVLKVTANDVAITYGEDVKNEGTTIEGLVDGDTLDGSETFAYSYTRYADVGSYTVTPSGLTSDNYEIGFYDGTMTVSQKEIAVNLTANGGVYLNVTASTATFVENSLVNGDDVAIAITYFGVKESGVEYEESSIMPTDAGTYTVCASIGSAGKAGNYYLPSTTADFLIAKADYPINDEISFEDLTLTYDGMEHSIVVTVKKATDIVTSYTGNGRTDAGSQTVTASFSGYDIYNYNTIADKTATLTINRLSVEGATITLGTALTYNGVTQYQQIASVEIAGLFATFDLEENSGKDAGDYTLKIVANGNYIGTLTQDFTISRLDIASATITLGTSLTYNGESQTQTVAKVMMGELEVTYTLTDNVQTNVSASGYFLTVTGTGNYVGVATKAWNILPKQINSGIITLGDSLTYNGKEQTQTVVSIVVDGLVATFDVTGNVQKNAGSYTLTATGNGNFGGVKNKAFTIATKALTIKAVDKTIAYGDEPTNGGADFIGFAEGEDESNLNGTLKYAYTYTLFGNVGDYVITPSGYKSSNYVITYQTGVLTVNPYEVTLLWSGVLRYTGEAQAPICTVETLNGDICEVTVTGQQVTVGSYTATATALSDGNYVLPAVTTYDYEILPSFVAKPTETIITYIYSGEEYTYIFNESCDKALYTVTGDKRTQAGTQTVTATLNDKVNYYWEDESYADVTFTFTVEKLVLTEPTLDDLTYTGSKQQASVVDENLNKYYEITANEGGTDVGNYSVTVTVMTENCVWKASVGNSAVLPYKILQAENIWTVAPAVSDITYGETLAPSATAQFGSAVYAFRKGTGEFGSVVPSNAGVYEVSFSVEGTANYTALYRVLTVTIAKATMDTSKLAWNYTGAFTYDGTAKNVTLNGVPAQATATLSENEKTNAGTYTAVATFAYDEENYNTVAIDNLTWTIDPKGVSALWQVGLYSYTGSNQVKPSASFVGLTGTIPCTVTVQGGKAFKDAGKYVLEANSTDTNYAIVTDKTKTVEIYKQKVSIPTATVEKLYCNGTAQKYPLPEDSRYTVQNDTMVSAGTQTITISLVDTNNYQWMDGTTADVLITFTMEHRFGDKNGDPSKVVIPATCLEKGTYYRECACGEREEYEYGSPLGHDYVVEFLWSEEKEAEVTAHVSCARENCDHTEEVKPSVAITADGIYYEATVTLDRDYKSQKRRGAATWEGDYFDYPIWTWTWNNKTSSYDAVAKFECLDNRSKFFELEGTVTVDTSDKTQRVFFASVVFGDKNSEFTDEKVVKSVSIHIVWVNGVTETVYGWYNDLLSDVVSMPESLSGNYTQSGFLTDKNVFIPFGRENEFGLILDKEEINLTAVMQTIGKANFVVVWSDGTPAEKAKLSLNTVKGEKNAHTDKNGKASFTGVEYGYHTIKLTDLTQKGKKYERSYDINITSDQEYVITIAGENVVAKTSENVSIDNYEKVVSKENNKKEVALTVQTEEPSEEVKNKLSQNKGGKYNCTIIDFVAISVKETVTQTNDQGEEEKVTQAINETEEYVTIKYELPEEVLHQLANNEASLSNLVVYRTDSGNKTVHVSKKEYTGSQEFYTIETSGSTPYLLLTTNKLTAFAIGMQDNVVREKNQITGLSIADWTYGEIPSNPEASALYGTIQYTYSDSEDGTFTANVPTKAGSYYLKATVYGCEEYTGAEQTVAFNIAKANYNLNDIRFSGKDIVADGNEHTLEIFGDLPEGVSVEYIGNGQSAPGSYTIVARFTSDNENYNIIPEKTATLIIESEEEAKSTNIWLYVGIGGGVLLLILLLIIILGAGKKGGGALFKYSIGR